LRSTMTATLFLSRSTRPSCSPLACRSMGIGTGLKILQ
jgi:hypothetical protein